MMFKDERKKENNERINEELQNVITRQEIAYQPTSK